LLSIALITCRYNADGRFVDLARSETHQAMINSIGSPRSHLAEFGALQNQRTKRAVPAEETTAEPVESPKAAHPTHPQGHIPPGLARAAEKIASKVFARADADESGTVTLQELSALHSKHARTLASSELFRSSTAGTPPNVVSVPPLEPEADITEAPSDTGAEVPVDSVPTNSPEIGLTEAQVKEALTQFFYAKVGITYRSPAEPSSEPVTPMPTDGEATPVVEPTSAETNQHLSAVA
jgi:hypothetical protein